MKNFKRKKVLIFIISFILFFFIFFLYFFQNEIKLQNQVYMDNLILNVSINNQLCAYDSKNNVYYYSSDNLNYNQWDVKLNSLYDLRYIVNINNNDSNDNSYILTAYNNDFYQSVKIVITSLPIIDLHNFDFSSPYTINNFPSTDIDLDMFYDDKKSLDTEYITSFYSARVSDALKKNIYCGKVGLKLRGASSILYPKKAYKIMFDKKVKLLESVDDDKYVLDALYIDKSKIRNLLSSDVWNIINDNQYIQNDLHGRFVELFVDDEYLGLYVLKEKVDRSVANVSNNGVLLKSIDHMYETYIDKLLNNNNGYNIFNNTFLNFEVKKYNDQSFNSLVDKIKLYYNDSLYNSINENFDLDNYINYYIFVSLIGGNDNIDYNYYLSLHDSQSKILITPWDMDLTWGLNSWNLYWNDDTFDNLILMESSSDTSWMENNIVKNMDFETLTLLKQRYWELRKSVVTMDTINEYLDSYKELLVNSGAVKRDGERWYEYDIEFEIEQIREWASRRIAFLDEYFK